MNLLVLANLAVFGLTLGFLYQRRKGGASIASNVLLAVLLGVILGALLQTAYGLGHAAIAGTLTWVGVVGGIYVRVLQMVVVPLVFVSILGAVSKLHDARALGSISGGVIGQLLLTTALSAGIGVGITNLFGLRASRLYQDNFDRIFRHVRALTGDPYVSEELVQETFVHALLRISSFDGRSAFSTWLHGVAINVVRNHWRSQKSTAKAHARLEVVRDIEGPGDEPGVAVHRQQRVKALYAALETLPETLRVAFVLRDLEGLSPEEAAHRLEISPGNVAVRANRARQRIRKQLIEWGVLTPDAEARS